MATAMENLIEFFKKNDENFKESDIGSHIFTMIGALSAAKEIFGDINLSQALHRLHMLAIHSALDEVNKR